MEVEIFVRDFVKMERIAPEFVGVAYDDLHDEYHNFKSMNFLQNSPFF